MNSRLFWVVVAGVFAWGAGAQAELCGSWGAPYVAGEFNSRLLPEASGIAASYAIPGRLYHHNDSGDDLSFIVTDLKGAGARRVSVRANQSATDVEDIGRGPCGNGGTCLFLADIGDNSRWRRQIEVVIVPELATYGSEVNALAVLQLRYPDGAHDAESLAVHPVTRDIFIVTKEDSGVSGVYKVPGNSYPAPGKVFQLQKVGEIRLRELNSPGSDLRVTAMDIAPNGKSFVLLTYSAVIELNLDLSAQTIPASRDLKAGRDYQWIRVDVLPKQEAISYLPDGRSLVYDSEKTGKIMRVDCSKAFRGR